MSDTDRELLYRLEKTYSKICGQFPNDAHVIINRIVYTEPAAGTIGERSLPDNLSRLASSSVLHRLRIRDPRSMSTFEPESAAAVLSGVPPDVHLQTVTCLYKSTDYRALYVTNGQVVFTFTPGHEITRNVLSATDFSQNIKRILSLTAKILDTEAGSADRVGPDPFWPMETFSEAMREYAKRTTTLDKLKSEQAEMYELLSEQAIAHAQEARSRGWDIYWAEPNADGTEFVRSSTLIPWPTEEGTT